MKLHAYHFFIPTLPATAKAEPEEDETASESEIGASISAENIDGKSFSWMTRDELKAYRKVEEGKHAFPIINKVRSTLEIAVEQGEWVTDG